ncbi:MAG: holo-ACP synthase [Acetobacteraceae bacterium]|nr:holo-ACP synthase [Acetobacteraceae bacterium]
MILGLGLDLVEVAALEASIRRQGRALLERVYAPEELAELGLGEGAGDAVPDRVQLERLAARFAAKEAAFKALGTGWAQGVGWRDVRVLGSPSGRPRLVLSGAAAERARELGAEAVLVSLTHAGGWAAAAVVIDGPAPPA